MSDVSFSAQQMVSEILNLSDYTLARISDETGISRSTLSRIYHNVACFTQLRNFNKLLRLYCQLIPKQ